YNQVNLTILGNLEARKIPVIIVANKIDLKNSNIERVKEMFPQYEIVGISAKTGKNMEELYKTIFKVAK
ncbi:MAG: GTP-binding protein, partial [Candidatus Nanoarchaeia archaeon]|nr:GTP-binding protein [Candidatus Nanoarchaeia archaeon]